VTIVELGAPTTSTAYRLCVYDTPAGVDTLAIELSPPMGPRWRTRGERAVKYTDHDARSGGARSVFVTTGGHRKARASFRASGETLSLPSPALTRAYFHQSPHVTVQLANDMGVCWTSRLTGASSNTPTRFLSLGGPGPERGLTLTPGLEHLSLDDRPRGLRDRLLPGGVRVNAVGQVEAGVTGYSEE